MLLIFFRLFFAISKMSQIQINQCHKQISEIREVNPITRISWHDGKYFHFLYKFTDFW